MKRFAHVALAFASVTVATEARAAAAPRAREQAELLAQAGEARYRLALLRPRKGDLDEALRALEEARALDPANLRALAYLGLARLASAAHGRRVLDRELFDSVREPLECLFKLSRGWADPRMRVLLAEVARALDALLGRDAKPDDAGSHGARVWWQSWRERVTKAAESASPGANVMMLVEGLRTSPLAWVREHAAEKLAEKKRKPRRATSRNEPDAARPQAEVVEALAKALREDNSPWVRAAAAKALSTLMPPGWDVRLAEALRNDGSVFVRRTCAEELAGLRRDGRRAGSSPAVRAALVRALESDTPRVASAAAWSLGALGGSPGKLVQALESESGLIRSMAATALWRSSLEAALSPKILPLLSHERPGVRAAAVFALGTGPGHLPEPVLRRVVVLLDDEETEVRASAATALFNRRVPDTARARLRSLLDDRDARVRLSAAEVLLQSGDEAAKRVLEGLCSSDVPTIIRPDGSEIVTVGEAAREIIEQAGKQKGKRP